MPSPKTSRCTAATRRSASASLTVAGKEAPTLTSGSRGQPAAWHSPAAIRRIAATIRSRTASDWVRRLREIRAVEGMMFGAVPASIRPTVSTADSRGAISRLTTLWSRVTRYAAVSTGSTVVSGRDPCPPRPCTTISMSVVADRISPGTCGYSPTGPGAACCPSSTSGRGTRA